MLATGGPRLFATSMETPDPKVLVPLSEIQRIRDVLARLPERHTSNMVRNLFNQVAGLYQRLAKELQCRTPS